MIKDLLAPPCDEYFVDQKTGIITRHPSLVEIKRIMKAMEKQGGPVYDLYKTPSWVAEENGQIVGCFAANLFFEVSSLPVQSVDVLIKAEGRAQELLFEACSRWMLSGKNPGGVTRCVTEVSCESAQRMLARLGWKIRSFANSKVFGRSL